MTPDNDVLRTVARYAPHELMTQWSQTSADAVLLDVLGHAPTTTGSSADDRSPQVLALQPRSRPAGRRRFATRALPVAASVAVLGAGLLVAVLTGSGGSGGGQAGGTRTAGGQPFGPEFTPPAGLSTHALGRHSYSYRYVDQFDTDAAGHARRDGRYRPDAMTMRTYVGYDGTGVSLRTGDQHGCVRLRGHDSTGHSVPSLAAWPTDVDKLQTYLLAHVNGGSGSRDGAVFNEVADALAFDDGLASPRLRAAMLAVLSRTPGVRLHYVVRDFLGRDAIRADFVDPPVSGPLVQSLYFDPSDFRLLESSNSNDDAQWTYTGPTPAYTAAPPTDSDDPEQPQGQSLVELTRTGGVVRHLPRCR